MAANQRDFIRRTFQAEPTTRLGKLLELLITSEDGRQARDLIQEAIEAYWMPTHLLALYQFNQITKEQYRQKVLLALAHQKAWFMYCQRLTDINFVVPEEVG